ncbi:MAG TPA: response regulator, partial [Nitrospirota bacterium]
VGALKAGPDKIHIQDIYRDPHLGKQVMAFSGLISDPSRPGKPDGVAVLLIGLDDTLYPLFSVWPGMKKSGESYLVRKDDDGILVLSRLRYRPDSALNLRFPAADSPPAALNAASGREGIIEAIDYRHMMALAAYRYIPETRWGLVVKEDYDDAFATVNTLTRKVAVGMSLTFLLVIILIYILSKKFADPIILLNNMARRIAGGDFDVTIPVKSRDEVGSLAESFNEMANSLAEYRRQVEDKSSQLMDANRVLTGFAHSLEEKVQQRTSELEEAYSALDNQKSELEQSQDELRKYADELEQSRNRVRENLEIVEKANVELRRMDSMKDHFIGMMSHELRTPLSLITGYSSNALTDTGLQMSPMLQEAMQGISRGADRLKNIVSEMLDISQIDTKGLNLHFENTELPELVLEVISEISSFIVQRRQVVELGEREGLPVIPMDRMRMHQVLLNVIGNAVKFTPDGGYIGIDFIKYDDDCRVISDGRRPSYIDVVVSDSGIGLDHEELERIFEKFYEVGEIDKHVTSKYEFLGRGVGLGLPIAKGIVEAHGGRIWVDSPGYDPEACPGSTFHIALPVDRQTRRRPSPGPATAEEIMRSGKAGASDAVPGRQESIIKILVIDDDPDILSLTTRVLRSQFEVHCAESGKQGLEMLRELHPEVVLLDVYMDDMTGYEVCAEIKREGKKGVRVAMFTAGAQKWEIEKGFKSGADDYITKPFMPAELIGKIKVLGKEALAEKS